METRSRFTKVKYPETSFFCCWDNGIKTFGLPQVLHTAHFWSY
jgi:hypothetical protein